MIIKLFPLTGQLTKSAGWLRIFGLGFAYKDTRIHPLLFSERNGFVKMIKIGNWNIKAIK